MSCFYLILHVWFSTKNYKENQSGQMKPTPEPDLDMVESLELQDQEFK